jgi:hypothetical protein
VPSLVETSGVMPLATAAWFLDRSMHEDDGPLARLADDHVRPVRLHMLPRQRDDAPRLFAKATAHLGPPM